MLNQYEWTRRLSDGVDKYLERGVGEWTFTTVTSHEKLTSLAQTLYVWPNAWGKLSRRIRYHYPGWKYALLPEQHKDTRLHIHMIASGGLSTRFLKTHARACGLGHQTKSEPIRNGQETVKYSVKYLSKSTKDLKWPTHFRRVRTSQRWPKLENRITYNGMDINWSYFTSYPSDGLDYLAEGLREKKQLDVRVLR
jgi:hypothetical protein